ncbi:HlyD family secretion protein [Hoeflea sp. CAU 1731]
MLELLICSMITILPDYLYRRYGQGKRIGQEITIYTMWYELRWGIVSCLLLTISLVTVVFYYHPSTKFAASMYRTVTILPEGGGRVSEVFVKNGEVLKAGQEIFRLDDSEQRAAVETARKSITEIDAATDVAIVDLEASKAKVAEAQSAYQQALDEYNVRAELVKKDVVSQREVERLQNAVDARQAGVDAAQANLKSLETKISTQLPAQKASAEARLEEAEVALSKTVVRAGIDGTVEQFILRPGDFVSPILRPAGIIIPIEAGRGMIQAGFGQISAQEIKLGMIAEAVCVSRPLSIIPLKVADIQDYIAAGQVRPSDVLIDTQQLREPGSLLAFLEPVYEGSLDSIPPGSSCIVNAYTNNHDRLQNEDLGFFTWLGLHMVDAVGLIHAVILRIQALLLPFKLLVFSGH